MKFAASVILPLFALDQITKWLVLLRIPFGGGVPVIPGLFNIVHVYNTGAAFGMGSGNNWFFVGLSLLVAGALVWLARRGHLRSRIHAWAACLIGAGLMGNLTDRLLHGHVVDFLDFYVGTAHWPAFNVADSCICIAAALFAYAGFRDPEPAAPRGQ
jgi:signal peptidase II